MFDYPYQKTFVIERGDAGAKAYRDEYVYALEMETERLQAIVDKLPKTTDGVSITPGMTIWLNTRKSEAKGIYVSSVGAGFYGLKDKPRGCYHDKVYSSKQAAEAAKEKG